MQKTKKEPVKGKRAGTPGVGTQATLQVRLWAGNGGIKDVPAGALAMVQDFLSVSPCEPPQMSEAAGCGVFPDLVQAVNAGRRLQRMVQGYSKAVNGDLGAGLLLMGGNETVSDQEMDELRQKQALSHAQPGQMFVVGALCDKVKSIPGLDFKEIEAGLASGGDGKPRRVMFVLPGTGDRANSPEDEMKTRVVQSFDKTPATKDGGDSRKAAPLVLAPIGVKVAQPPAVAVSAAKTVQPTAAKPSPSLWERPQVRWGVAGGGALLVALAAAMGMHGRGTANTAAPAASASTSVSAGTPPAQPTAATQPVSDPVKNAGSAKAKGKADGVIAPKLNAAGTAQPPQSLAPGTAAAAPDATRKDDADRATESAKHEQERPVVPPPAPPSDPPKQREKQPSGGVSVSYSAEEINMLLSRADKDSGDGFYDKAITEYQAVLNHDPGNQRAKQGKERAIRNKGGG